MPRNVEIKASLTDQDRERISKLAARESQKSPEILCQTDTFFRVNFGRLKLREFGDSDQTSLPTELIQYHRPDQAAAKTSSYQRIVVEDLNLVSALRDSLGIMGVVKKRREVFVIGQTRVHLDEVADLGLYLELEVVLDEDQTSEFGEREMARIMRLLEIESPNLISVAYIDLLLSQ